MGLYFRIRGLNWGEVSTDRLEEACEPLLTEICKSYMPIMHFSTEIIHNFHCTSKILVYKEGSRSLLETNSRDRQDEGKHKT